MSPGSCTIRPLEPADYSRWDAFVREAPDGTFYHLSGWKKLIEEELRHRTHYLYCERNGEIVAVLPLARIRTWFFGDSLISTPFLVYGGPVATDDESRSRIVEAARELAEDFGVDYLELRNRVPLEGEWHLRNTHVTFRKTISADPEENLMAVPRKQRAMIRKGIKAGLKAEVDMNTDRLYSAILASKRNLGTPFFGRGWLHAIKQEFGDQAEVLTVTRKDKIVCSVMSFYFRDEVLPYYGGGGDMARDLKGNDFMYWAVMEKACRNGIAVFDYGRSMVGSGSYRFKKHWGFDPEPLAYQIDLVRSASVPQITPGNPRFQLAINAWKRLPLPVAGALGPFIARRLG